MKLNHRNRKHRKRPGHTSCRHLARVVLPHVKRISYKSCLLICVIAASLLMYQTSDAEDWNTGGSGDWNTAGNWNPASVPNAIDASATFPSGFPGVDSTINVSSAVIVGSLSFDDNTTSNITGSTITMDVSGGVGTMVFSTGSWSIANDLIFNDPVNITTTANGALSGNISGGSSLQKLGAGTLFLTGTNTYTGGTNISNGTIQGTTNGIQGNITNNSFLVFDQTISGTYSDVLSGSGNVTIQNTGTVTFSGNNLYTGDTILNGGVLAISNDNNLGNTVGTLIFGGGTLQTGAAITSSRTATLNAGGGTIDTNTFDSTFSGVFSGTGAFEKTGTGTLTLTGANTYSGGTTVSGGSLEGNVTSLQGDITNNANVIFNQGSTATFSDIISGTGSITKTGAGLLTLSGANTYSGGTTISAGVIQGTTTSLQGNILNNAAMIFNQAFDGSHTGNITGTGAFSKDGAGKVTLSGTNTYSGGTTVTLGTLEGTTDSIQGAITNNASVIFDQTTTGTYSGVMIGTGSLTKNGTGTVTLSGANTYTGGTTISAGALQGTTTSLQGDITNNASLIFDQTTTGAYSDVISGTGSVTKQNTGTVTLSGANTYTGDTNINGGILIVSANSNLGDNSNGITFDGGTLQTTAGIGSARNVTLNAGGGIFDTNGFDSSISGIISGTGDFTKTGAGTLTFSGVNTYTGDTNINGGILSIGANNNLGDAGNGLTFDGGTLLTTGGITSARNVTLNAGGGTVDTNAFDSAFSGIISGTADFTKSGAGTLTLSGVNTYTGTTNIYGGTISVGADNNLGNVANNIDFNNGSLLTTAGITSARNLSFTLGSASINTNGFDSTFSGILSGNKLFTKSGTGTLTLSGTNTYTGGTTVSAGVLQGTTTSIQGDVLNNAGVIIDQASNGTYSDVMTGTGTLTKNGTGTVTLSGANTYSGGTTINAGVLQGTTTSLQGNILNNASLIFDQTISGTYSDVISGTGSVTKSNTGTTAFSGVNTYTGDTNINGGILSISANSNLGDVTNLLTFDGGTLLTTAGITSARNVTLNVGGGTFNTNGFDSAFSGVISGTGDWTKTTAGTLTLSGANTYTGATNIDGGTISIGANNNLGDAGNVLTFDGGTLVTTAGITSARNVTLNAGGGIVNTNGFDSIFSGILSGTGDLSKAGTGTLTLSGVNTYTGNTNVNAGILSVGADNNLGNAASDLIFDGGALLTTAGITSTRDVTLNAGNGAIDTNSFDSAFSGVFSGTGGLGKSGTGTLTLSGTNTYTGGTTVSAGVLQGTTDSLQGNIVNNATVTFNQAGSGAYSGIMSGTGALIKNGGGTVLTLTGANTYSGGTTINAGTLQGNTTSLQGNILNNASLVFDQAANGAYSGVISGTGSVTKQNTGIVIFSGTNTYSGATNINGGSLSIGNNSNLGDASNTLAFDGGTLLTTGGILSARNVTLNVGGGTIDTNAFDSTFSGIISGTGDLTKIGAGDLTLTGANTFLGNVNLNGGNLVIGDNGQLGNITNDLIFDGGIFQTSAGFTSARDVTLNVGDGTIDTNTFDSTFTGIFSGAGAFNKSGIGTLTLSGINTYTGGTTVSGGTLQGTTDSLQGDITNNSIVIFNQAIDGSYGGSISGTGSLVKDGVGTVLTLTGTNTYTGGTTVTAGTLQGTTDSLQGNIFNNASVIFDQTFTGTFGGVLSGTGAVTKQNSGAVTFSGTNTYTGDTNINGGLIVVGDNSNLGNASNTLIFDGGALQTSTGIISARDVTLNAGGGTVDTNGVNSTFSGILSGTGAFTKNGTGTLILSGTNTYTGGTTVSGGTLRGTTNSLQGNILNNATLYFDQAVDGTYADVISGIGSLTKQNTGTLTLTGTNTYTGDTNINGGTISIGAIANLGALSNIMVFDGGTLQTTSSIVTSRNVTLNAGGGIFDTNGFDSTLSGVISGTGSFSKAGTGILTISGVNSYTGNTDITGGTLLLGAANTLPGGTNVSISTGAILDLNGNVSTIGDLSGSGDIQLGAGVLTAGGIANTTYTGIVSGTGSLIKDGTGTLTLSGANTYSGGSTVSTGLLQGTTTSLQGDITNNAGVIFNQAFTGTYADVLSGTGTLVKNGTGNVIFAGNNTYGGITTINAGSLFVNGSINSNTTINSGGRLGGNGTITGTVTANSGGTIGAGNSIGTLNIAGDLTLGTGSTLEVEIQSAFNPTTPGVHNDVVNVTGNVNLGGALDVLASPGIYAPDTEYTFLQYTGTLTGTFSGVSNDLAFLDAILKYNSGSISFILSGPGSPVDFSTPAFTKNQYIVGDFLEERYFDTTGDLKNVMSEMLFLNDSQLRGALDQLSPDLYGSTALIGIQNTTYLNARLHSHIRPGLFQNKQTRRAAARAKSEQESAIQQASHSVEDVDKNGLPRVPGNNIAAEQGGWILGYNMEGSITTGDNFGYSTGGVMLGYDRFLNAEEMFGYYLSLGGTNINNRSLLKSTEVNSTMLGAYMNIDDGKHYTSFSTALGLDNYDSSRHIGFGTVNRDTLADYTGWQGTTYLERGMTLCVKGDHRFQPYVALQYIYLWNQQFKETGADELSLKIKELNAHSLRTLLGGRFGWKPIKTRVGVTVIPEMRLAWGHELLDSFYSVDAKYKSIGDAGFSVHGVGLGHDWGLFGLGTQLHVNDHIKLFLDYDTQFNNRHISHSGTGGMEMKW